MKATILTILLIALIATTPVQAFFFNSGGIDPFNSGGVDPFNSFGVDPFNSGGTSQFNSGGVGSFSQAFGDVFQQPFTNNQPSNPINNVPPNTPPAAPVPQPAPQPAPSPSPSPVPQPTVNSAPVLSPIGNKAVYEGQLLTFTITATDANGDALTFSTSALPSGAQFSGATFSWTPSFTQAGTYQVTFTATDGLGGSALETIYIFVYEFDQQAYWTSTLADVNVTQASPDWTVLQTGLDQLCSDPDGTTPALSVESWSWNFDLFLWYGTLYLYNLNPFFVGNEVITLGCNSVPASFTLNVVAPVLPQKTVEHKPELDVHIGTITLQDTARAGDSLTLTLSFKNSGDKKLKSVKAKASIPELGVRSPSAGPLTLGVGKKTTETLVLDIPEDSEPGTYTVRITIDSGSVHRTVHRDIVID